MNIKIDKEPLKYKKTKHLRQIFQTQKQLEEAEQKIQRWKKGIDGDVDNLPRIRKKSKKKITSVPDWEIEWTKEIIKGTNLKLKSKTHKRT